MPLKENIRGYLLEAYLVLKTKRFNSFKIFVASHTYLVHAHDDNSSVVAVVINITDLYECCLL